MNAALDQPFVRAATALRNCRANLADAVRWMHPSWPMALLQLDAAQFDSWSRAVERATPAARERVSLQLCASAGIALPTLEELAQPLLQTRPDGVRLNLALLDACPAALGLQILRMRALSFRRTEVRRLIDKRTRAQLSGWAGVPVDQLCPDTHLADAPRVATLHTQIRMPLLASLDADALAVEGLLLMERDAGLRNVASRQLLRCALPYELTAELIADLTADRTAGRDARRNVERAANLPAWLAKLAADVDSLGTARLFAQLPILLPEWAWLSG